MDRLESLQVDTTTLVLGGVVLFLLGISIWLRAPAPPIHPFLLGRQSIPSRTRAKGESPVYTNGSTGGLRTPVRPDKDIKTLHDIVKSSEAVLDGQRGTWSKGNESVREVVYALRAGLVQKIGKQGSVCVFVSEPSDALLLTLALCLANLKPTVIAPGSSLASHSPFSAVFYSAELKSVAEGIPSTSDAKKFELNHVEPSQEVQDILHEGRQAVKDQSPDFATPEPSDVCLTIVSEGIALPFTHANLTSALVSWLAMFPSSPSATKPNANDIVYSFHHPSAPYGLGLALFLVHCSSSLALVRPPSSHETLFETFPWRPKQAPTVLFAPQETSDMLYRLLLTPLLRENKTMIKLARNGKMRLLRQGVLATSSIWDTLVFGSMRTQTRLMRLRFVVMEGQYTPSRLDFMRMGLGQPAIIATAHPFLLCPLAASHIYDFQHLPHPSLAHGQPDSEKAHSGPPAVGVEVKLVGQEDDFQKGHMRGEILMRSTVLPQPDKLPQVLISKDEQLEKLPSAPNERKRDSNAVWLRSGRKAVISPEGTIWIS